MYTVYRRITPDGKSYIGCTSKSLEERAGRQGTGYYQNKAFFAAIQKFGWSSIKTEIILQTEDILEAREAETDAIETYQSKDPEHGYNAVDSGFSMDPERITHLRTIGKSNWERSKTEIIQKRRQSVTPEYRKSISDSIKKKWDDPSYRNRVSESMKKRYEDPEVRKQMSEAMQAVWTDERKKEHSDLMRSVMNRPEVRSKLKATKNTQEYKDKMARIRSDPEIRARQSASMSSAWNKPGYRDSMSNKMAVKKWIHKDGVNRRVDADKVELYVSDGWILGRCKGGSI